MNRQWRAREQRTADFRRKGPETQSAAPCCFGASAILKTNRPYVMCGRVVERSRGQQLAHCRLLACRRHARSVRPGQRFSQRKNVLPIP